MTTTGYTGFLAGPPLVGFVAEVTSLRVSLAAVGLLCLTAAAITVGNSLARRASEVVEQPPRNSHAAQARSGRRHRGRRNRGGGVPSHAASSKTVVVKNNSFSPKSVSVKKGGKVVWKWTQGGVAHKSPPPTAARLETSSQKGYTFTKAFSKAGTFRYVCTLHSSMKMTVKVS